MEFVNKSTVMLEEAMASDVAVARAAWVSNYGADAREKDAEKIKGLINFLYRERHMSPFEHGMLKFYVECPIFVAREFMRHRTFSYNEMSGRYTELPPRFYVPPAERPLTQVGSPGKYTFSTGTESQQATTHDLTVKSYVKAWESYQGMMKDKVAREVARNVLPVGIMTQFYVTGNPRNWMQFFTLRNDKNALYEIRMVAQAMEEWFAGIMPLTYAAYKQYDWRNEREELESLRGEASFLRKRVAQLEAELTYV